MADIKIAKVVDPEKRTLPVFEEVALVDGIRTRAFQMILRPRAAATARRVRHRTPARRSGRPPQRAVRTQLVLGLRAWQQLVVLTPNLLRNFSDRDRVLCVATDPESTLLLQTIQTLRLTLFHRGRTRTSGRRSLLRLASDLATERLFTLIDQTLPCAA